MAPYGRVLAPVICASPFLPTIAAARFRIQSDSGDGLLRSLTIEASGKGDDTNIDNVMLVVDTNGDGVLNGNDVTLANGAYLNENGTLTFPPGKSNWRATNPSTSSEPQATAKYPAAD